MFSILDCTLRDGGYYTNWDFDKKLVQLYLQTMSKLPISYVELGYRSPLVEGYTGEFFHLPRRTLEQLRSAVPNAPPFALMLDAKNNTPNKVSTLLADCQTLVKLVRIAVDPNNLDHGLALACAVHDAGFEVGINLMYLSDHWNDTPLFDMLAKKAEFVSYISLVDSFGSCFPEQVNQAFHVATNTINVPLGFHAHDNLTLAFSNAIAAISGGASIVDSTVLGMGRGAGNLKTEILVGFHAEHQDYEIDLLPMAQILEQFTKMRDVYQWGCALPYIVSGFGNLPQKKVMSLLSKNRYSTYSIVQALQGKESTMVNESKFMHADALYNLIDKENTMVCIIIGGGETAINHAPAIIDCAKKYRALLIHSSIRNTTPYLETDLPQVLCIVGDEASKIQDSEAKILQEKIMAFVVDNSYYCQAPLPGTFIHKTFDVAAIRLPDIPENSLGMTTPLGAALGVGQVLQTHEIWLAGFDGYEYSGAKYKELEVETQGILDAMKKEQTNIPISSLTPTHYNVTEVSVYARNALIDENTYAIN